MYGILLLLGTMWGGSFSLAKVAAAGGGAPMGIALYTSGLGATILLTATLARGYRLSLRGDAVRYYLMTGICGVAVPGTALYAAAAHLPAGILSMLVATSPMLTYGMAVALSMERREARRLVGIVLGFSGVTLLVLPRAALPSDADPCWLAVAMIAPACYSLNTILVARFRPRDGDNISLAGGMLLAAAMTLAAIAVPTGNTVSMLPPWNASHLGILGLGTISGLAFFLYLLIVTRAGPVFFSQVGYIVTGTGVLWGMLIFGERHGPLVWLALAVLIAGVALVRPRRQTPPASA